MEQVIVFKCMGHRKDSIENIIEELNEWLRENSEKVIQRNVTTDSDGWPIIYIFYKTNKTSLPETDDESDADDA